MDATRPRPSSPRVTASFLLSAAFLVASCSSSTQKILTHSNAYAFYLSNYTKVCVTVEGPPSCADYFAALVEYKSNLVEASAARQRGGSLSLQLNALDASQKKVEALSGKRP